MESIRKVLTGESNMQPTYNGRSIITYQECTILAALPLNQSKTDVHIPAYRLCSDIMTITNIVYLLNY